MLGTAAAIEMPHIATSVSAIFSLLCEQNINGLTIPKKRSIDIAVMVSTEDTYVITAI